MEEEYDLDVGGNITLGGVDLELVETTLVNKPRDIHFVWINLPLLLLTGILNTWAVIVIRKKEKNGINDWVITGCLANILYYVCSTFSQSPWFNIRSFMLCTVFMIVLIFLGTFNRLISVTIAVFRYIMVCHPVFSVNHGGDKVIWRNLSRSAVFLAGMVGASIFWNTTTSLTFLECRGKEEVFWYDCTDQLIHIK